ncbi:MAG: ABC transporter ATP-binding protein [Verrucomicrobia bacterium]|nr:ABC transporter ATP-binding protein [Verrucomicrobiota bacterium]
MPLLEVENLRTSFYTRAGVVRAVDGVSFSVDGGETLGIVGESGSGKSVTCYSILGLVPQPPGRIESGSARFDGVDLLACKDSQLRRFRGKRISMIFQDPMTSLNPYLRVSDQLIEPLLVHERVSRRQALKRAIASLEEVGIQDAGRRVHLYPHQFSGGMRQRVMIAMALINRPEILIADEPTTALDVTVQAQILELIRRRQQDLGTAIIFITHDLGVVASFCRRVNVMYAGRVVESGLTEDIFAAPLHPYNAALQQSIPALHRKGESLFTIPGAPPDLSRNISGCSFAPRCPFAVDLCRNSPTTLEEPIAEHSTACLRVLRGEVNDLRLRPALAAV